MREEEWGFGVEDVLRSTLIYALADSLDMPISVEVTEPVLRGRSERTVDFGGLTVPFKAEIISCLPTRQWLSVIVKVKGNLALLLSAAEHSTDKSRAQVTLYVLNMAKMGKAHFWLEDNKPKNKDALESLLDKAIVRKFTRTGMKWSQAAWPQ